jgi:nitroreductase
MVDIYQKRYIIHQKNKKETIEKKLGEENKKHSSHNIYEIMLNRRSQRIFNKKPIDNSSFKLINKFVVLSPSSCNRQAIYIQKISPKDSNLDLLVGGVGWIHKAKSILFIYADMLAYKSPNEVDFMPYIDAGVVVQSIYLTCESIGLGCCYINPNLKIKNQLDRNGYKFMGAMALGYYNKKAIAPKKRKTAFKKIIG